MLTAVKATDRSRASHASERASATCRPFGSLCSGVPLSEHASATFLTVPRIFLSPPDVGARERALLLDAFDSNWIAPLGPDVDAFERELAGVRRRAAPRPRSRAAPRRCTSRCCCSASGPATTCWCPTLTFVATANAVAYVGARPVFLDSDRATWNLDPGLLAEELAARGHAGRELPAAVIARRPLRPVRRLRPDPRVVRARTACR